MAVVDSLLADNVNGDARDRPTPDCHGGAIAVDRSMASVLVLNSSIVNNMAGVGEQLYFGSGSIELVRSH